MKISIIGTIIVALMVLTFIVFNKFYYCSNGICMPTYPPSLEGIKD